MVGNPQLVEVGIGIEPISAGMAQEVEKGLIKAFGIDDPDRLTVLFEFEPGHLLKEFLVGPDAAGEGDKGVGEFAHERLALMHGVDHAEIGKFGMNDLEAVHEMRNDADNGAVGIQAGICDGPHEAGAAAAVDEGEPALAEKAPGFAGDRPEGGMVAVARTTEDTYAVHPEQKEVC